ncbi:MAG: hypothetical protein OQL27_05415 [Sedimenticola sp.]|nr:hypothetical protein [Sedimenticola sp.]
MPSQRVIIDYILSCLSLRTGIGLFGQVFFLLTLLIPTTGFAAQTTILVLSSGEAPVYKVIAEQLKTQMNSSCASQAGPCRDRKVYELTYDANNDSLVIPANTKLVITLGLKAAEVVQRLNTGLPTVHALLPKSSADLLLRSSNQTAIYLDQPSDRQLKLARLITKTPHIGLLLGKNSATIEVEFIRKANEQSIPVSYRNVIAEESVGPLLKELLEESNILLALPDPTVFNRRTIFNILLSSYHNKVPVIGFSSAYVKAGALISVFSKPEEIALHLTEFSIKYLNSDTTVLPNPEYPKYFSVEINHSVARSLGISLPDEQELIQFMTDKPDK